MTKNVDITDLKETGRAQLSYFDATFLIDLQSHLSRKRGGESVGWRQETLLETLAGLYPDATFTRGEGEPRAYAPVIAGVKPGVESTLREALGVTFLAPGGFDGRLYEDRYGPRGVLPLEEGRVIFCPGGLGYIEDGGASEFFTHDLDLTKLKEETGGDQDEFERGLRQYFQEEVNDTLEDPYIDPNDLEDQPIHFLCGSEQELERLVQLFVLTEPGIEVEAGNYVLIRTATEEDGACLDPDDGYYSDRLNGLVEMALKLNQPEGWTHEYNDGPMNQASGYSLCSQSISYHIEEILGLPARVRMAARRDLKKWLGQQGHTVEEFDPEPFVTADGGDDAPASTETTERPEPEIVRDDEEMLFPTISLNLTKTCDSKQPPGDAGDLRR